MLHFLALFLLISLFGQVEPRIFNHDSEGEVTVIGNLECSLHHFCATVYFLDEDPLPIEDDFGKIEARCTSAGHLTHTVTFTPSYQVLSPFFYFGLRIKHNCTSHGFTMWKDYQAPTVYIFQHHSPVLYTIQLYNNFNKAYLPGEGDSDVEPENLIAPDFQVREVDGQKFENDTVPFFN